jgi:lysozyme
MIKGFDASHFQKINDWNAVKNDGYKFVFLKATEGNSYVDPTFVQYANGARAVGLEVGAYHFARFANPIDAGMEADFFLQHAEGVGLTLPLVLDLETNDNHLDKATLTACVNAFVDKVQAKGHKVIVYTYKGFMTNFDRPADTLFWYARYGLCSPDAPADFWQYTDKGTVAGISGTVDLDYFMGDVLPTIEGKVEAVQPAPVPHTASAPIVVPRPATYVVKRGDTFYGIAGKLHIDVQALMKANPTVKPRAMQIGAVLVIPNGQPVNKTYKVHAGDNLTAIANKFGVSLAELEKANTQITNPNLIQVGEVLNIPNGSAPAPQPAPKGDQNTVSIVDYLRSIGQDTSFGNRQRLASQYGIVNYQGTADQNLLLLKKIRGH